MNNYSYLSSCTLAHNKKFIFKQNSAGKVTTDWGNGRYKKKRNSKYCSSTKVWPSRAAVASRQRQRKEVSYREEDISGDERQVQNIHGWTEAVDKGKLYIQFKTSDCNA